mmetsp:Transcript_74769/g.201937  ORF Transcript_74769/g.201937 Transcript_74769/m.201937 type:complete len:241 (-) Transcript_74769:14-736(-)
MHALRLAAQHSNMPLLRCLMTDAVAGRRLFLSLGGESLRFPLRVLALLERAPHRDVAIQSQAQEAERLVPVGLVQDLRLVPAIRQLQLADQCGLRRHLLQELEVPVRSAPDLVGPHLRGPSAYYQLIGALPKLLLLLHVLLGLLREDGSLPRLRRSGAVVIFHDGHHLDLGHLLLGGRVETDLALLRALFGAARRGVPHGGCVAGAAAQATLPPSQTKSTKSEEQCQAKVGLLSGEALFD